MKKIKPIHPGEYLRELLDELGISAYALARHIGVSQMRISHILRGQRPLSAEIALLLERALGQSAQYWLNLQTRYDLDKAQDSANARTLSRIALLAA